MQVVSIAILVQLFPFGYSCGLLILIHSQEWTCCEVDLRYLSSWLAECPALSGCTRRTRWNEKQDRRLCEKGRI